MFGFKKSTYRFDVVHSDSINSQPIKDADALVNYVIGVNNDLLDKDEKGWLFIEKLKESKKGSTVLYATRLELPLLEDNSYFDQLLSPFYTKKKVAYDESLITPAAENITDDTTPDTPELPADLAALVQKGNDQLQSDSISNEIPDQPVASTQEPAAVDSSNQVKESTTPEEVELLKQQLKAKQEEIEQMQQREERPLPASEIQTTTTVSEEPAKILPEEKKGLFVQEPIKVDVPLQSSEQSVAAVIDRVRHDISAELNAFVSKETEKIEDEIQRLDRRGLIEKEISGRLQSEKDHRLDSELSLLIDEKEKLIREEELRHQSALKEIENNYLRNKQTMINEINSLFDQRYQAEYSDEYSRQTEQLVKILEGRQAELSRRQQELNEGLQANFANTLATFNQSHKQMIELVERQKETKQPVQLLKQA
jgi:hypothetical protein